MARKVTITACGVSAKADPEVLDDYDLLERIVDLGAESWAANVLLCRELFGHEEWERIKDGLRDEKGRLTKDRVMEFIQAANVQLEALKN